MRTVVVAGDVMIDSRIARSNRWAEEDGADGRTTTDHDVDEDGAERPTTKLFEARPYLQFSEEEGGAIQLGKILEYAIGGQHGDGPEAAIGGKNSAGTRICYPADPKTESYHPDEYSLWRTNVLVAQYPRTKGETGDHVSPVWRIRERLGVDRPRSNNGRPLLDEDKDPEDADIIAIEHLDQGFSSNASLWPRSLISATSESNRWLIIRWTRPRFDVQTHFWNEMVGRFRGKMIVVVTIESLRQFGMKINGLSWESLVSDLLENLNRVWAANLDGCRHLVVSCAPAAAIIVSATSEPTKPGSAPPLTAQLVYDPSCDEAEWFSAYDGGMPGRPRCLMAGIIVGFLKWETGSGTSDATERGSNGSLAASESEALTRGAIAGLLAGRYALHVGFVPEGQTERKDTALPLKLRFPTSSVGQILHAAMQSEAENSRTNSSQEQRDRNAWLAKERKRFSVQNLAVSEVQEDPGSWGLIDYAVHPNAALDLAAKVVRYGRDTEMPAGVPALRVAKLFAIDRHEIENLRSIRELIDSYLSSTIASKPLSIAVFGDAGSGKSFAIRQLAKYFNDRNGRGSTPQVREITLNLSQFTSPNALASALHRVRDIGLSGEMPLVFWDEFDTTLDTVEMGWLRYFLAPMQDGVFQDGSSLHNVGRAIFVFAGSSHPTMDEFLRHFGLVNDTQRLRANGQPPQIEDREKEREKALEGKRAYAKRIKAPDFVSRLRGFLNVPTLNHDGEPKTITLLRRAELLRTFLLDSAGDLAQRVQRKDDRDKEQLTVRLNVDEGVIRAFLRVEKFLYGARSMEALVRMSTLKGKRMFDRSSLPTPSQLELHVDAFDFLDHVDKGWAAPAATPKAIASSHSGQFIHERAGAAR